MSNFEQFKSIVREYMRINGVEESFLATLHEVSLNNADGQKMYLYNGRRDLEVVSMDLFAKTAYKKIKGASPKENPINTVDAFLINRYNEWYLIEFKDMPVNAKNKSVKDNLLKKAYANWYMILDIFYFMLEQKTVSSVFKTDNPVRFAKEHVCYILVCSKDKNPNIYNLVKNKALSSQNYTPPFMQRLKDYVFKDAYVYTEDFFERKFVTSFTYS